MARSMLVDGMLTALAALTAARSRGLPSGSPPPWRAAIVISLMHFENSLPRAWSVAPFFRLIVAHLEWPDMALSGWRSRDSGSSFRSLRRVRSRLLLRP